MALERWSGAGPYEQFMGRWSRGLAQIAVEGRSPEPGLRWLDVGCGTGAVSAAVLDVADPASLLGIDPSEAYVEAARERLPDPRATFEVGDALALPVPDRSVDRVVSGLVLNFVPDPDAAAREMLRVLVPGGQADVWVWDYADGMTMLRTFWDAVAAEDPAAAHLDEGARFQICRKGALQECLERAGFVEASLGLVMIEMLFDDFDDYWQPFLGGQGPASAYLTSLPEDRQARLQDLVREALPVEPDGRIRLIGAAHASHATAP